MIQRYTQPVVQTQPGPEWRVAEVPLFPDDKGDWVRYDDHAAHCAALDRIIESWKREEQEWHATNERLRGVLLDIMDDEKAERWHDAALAALAGTAPADSASAADPREARYDEYLKRTTGAPPEPGAGWPPTASEPDNSSER